MQREPQLAASWRPYQTPEHKTLPSTDTLLFSGTDESKACGVTFYELREVPI